MGINTVKKIYSPYPIPVINAREDGKMIIYKHNDQEEKYTAMWITFSDSKKSYDQYHSKSDIVEYTIELTEKSVVVDSRMGTTIYPVDYVKYISKVAPYWDKKD